MSARDFCCYYDDFRHREVRRSLWRHLNAVSDYLGELSWERKEMMGQLRSTRQRREREMLRIELEMIREKIKEWVHHWQFVNNFLTLF
ncbi:unnamed protein product [Caenorhabditis auriculariae]|uniref:Uncharacterized protein n=1 Tax=Caenorhabditis auriculariae TaxID=2777116 RepID=A0A8S1H0L0_9PELO|nr:unnamed protein product [Caenorhabditis auriculariae]